MLISPISWSDFPSLCTQEVRRHFGARPAWQVSLGGLRGVVRWSPSPCAAAAPGWCRWRDAAAAAAAALGVWHGSGSRPHLPARVVAPLEISEGGRKTGIHTVWVGFRNGISSTGWGGYQLRHRSTFITCRSFVQCTPLHFLSGNCWKTDKYGGNPPKRAGTLIGIHVWVVVSRQLKASSCFPLV